MFLIFLNVIMVGYASLLLLRRGFSKVLCWPEPVPIEDIRETPLGVMEVETGQ